MPRAFQTEPDNPAVHALVRLHTDIGGRRKANKAESKKLAQDMKHVEAVIRMFSPDYDVRRISVRRRVTGNPWFKRGTLYRAALDALRGATGPLTTREIADALLATRGITNATPKQHADLQAGIRASLENHAGEVVERVGEGVPKRWRLSP